jgi:hypothetical protein
MLRCCYTSGRTELMDESIACGLPVRAGQHVCDECGGDFCFQHITRCDFCGETLCVRCSPYHNKICAFNDVGVA